MSTDGSDGTSAGPAFAKAIDSIEWLLFDSLIHHMIEKGLLTKNDALSIVQTVAQIMRVRLQDADPALGQDRAALSMLERTYASFEAMAERPMTLPLDAENVHQLRPPLHRDRPNFPRDD